MRTKKHILVIRMSAMGDVAMTVPVIASLLQQNPNLKVTILTRSFFTPMFSQLPHTTIYEADVKGSHKGVLGLWRLSKELKQLGITEVADLHNVLRSTILKSFFSFSGMPFITIDKGRKEKKILTKLAAKNISPLKTTHERYADVFRKLGYSLALSEKVVLEKEKPTENLLPFLGKPSNTCIGIAPFAAFSGKMYPLELMENVIQQITKVSHHTVLLFGGGKKEIDQLQKWASTFPNCINTAGKLSFKEELTLISNLNVMVAMDSGNAHLSALYGVPTVTLWGVTHPYAGFAPFAQDSGNCLLSDRIQYPFLPTSVYGNKFPAGYENVMHTIRPTEVVKKIEALLVNTD